MDRVGIAAEISPVTAGERRRSEVRQHGLRRGRTWVLAGADLVALTVAYLVTYTIASWIAPPAISAPAPLLVALGVLAVPLWIAAFTAYHLYDHDSLRISVASVDEVEDLFHALLAGSLAVLLLAQALTRLEGWRIYSPVEAAIFLGAALVLVPLVRGSIRNWLFPRVMRRRRALIVGSGTEAKLVYEKLRLHREYGLDVIGFADGSGITDLPGPVLGGWQDVARIVDEFEIDRILLASSIASHEDMLELVRTLRRPELQVSIVPRYFEIFTSNARLDDIEGIPVVSLPPMRLGRSSRVLKRAFDMLVSGSALLLLSPVLTLVALVIRLDSRGPAIYRQPRRGRDGCTFRIAKFRTMHVGAEESRDVVAHMNDVDGPLFKIKGCDPRVTRIGGFLRRTSLDELPQLWNVLRGHMSLVGPRPFVVYEADKIKGWASRRLDMAPGITGLWQVLGRNDIPFADMVKLDYLYVTSWSLWWDVKILCQTIPVVLGRRGAY
jgi:exopolysaccharide biosynthesis polyprenyl glycosylphosphotransferase